MFFFKKHPKPIHYEYFVIAVLIFLAIVFSISMFLQFEKIQTLEHKIQILGKEILEEKNNNLSEEKIIRAESVSVKILSDVPAPNLSFSSFQDFINNPQNILPPNGEKKWNTVGTGVLFDNEKKLLFTASHVVANQYANFSIQTTSGEIFPVKIESLDNVHDIATLSFTGDISFVPLSFSEKPLERGTEVLSFGFLDSGAQFSRGIILAKNQVLNTFLKIENLVRFESNLQKGSSGGPVINTRGEIVGINIASNGTQSYFAPIQLKTE